MTIGVDVPTNSWCRSATWFVISNQVSTRVSFLRAAGDCLRLAGLDAGRVWLWKPTFHRFIPPAAVSLLALFRMNFVAKKNFCKPPFEHDRQAGRARTNPSLYFANTVGYPRSKAASADPAVAASPKNDALEAAEPK